MTLWERIKKFLKKFLPPPVDAFNRELGFMRDFVQKENSALSAEQHKEIERVLEVLLQQQKQINIQQWQMESLTNKVREVEQKTAALGLQIEGVKPEITALGAQIGELRPEITALDKFDELGKTLQVNINSDYENLIKQMTSGEERLNKRIETNRILSADGVRNSAEAVWAEIFNNTVTNSEWLKDKTFSPGRWAVGYPYLYVMYRVLDVVRPKAILELGLGQSTKMIAQYSMANTDVKHYVVESDLNWVAFFQKENVLPDGCKIVQMEYEMTPFKEAKEVRTYKGFSETFAGMKFNFISIDAPLGGDMKQYARVDVLKMMPECLAEDFVIMIDDCERVGEKHTVAEMEAKLQGAAIPYKLGRYSGKKDLVLITAEKMGFLTSM